MARLDLDVLGSAIEDVPFHGLDLAGNDHGAGFNARQNNFTGFVSVVEAVIRANSGSGSVHHPEGHAGQRFIFRPLNKFANNQGRGGGVVKIDGLGVVGIYHESLGFGVGIDAVAGDALQLRHHDGAGDAREDDLAVAVGVVDPVGGHLPVLVVHHLSVGVLDLELHALQRSVVNGTELIDDQVAEGLVEHLQRIGLVVFHLHGVGRIVQKIAGLGLYLPHDVAAGFQAGQGDKAPLIGAELAVGAAHYGPVRPGDLEDHIGQRLLCGGVHFLHQESALGSIGDHNGLGVAVGSDHHIGAGSVHDIAVRRLGLRQHIGPRRQIGDSDLAVGVGGEQAVLREGAAANDTIQADFTPCGGSHTELRTGEGLAGDAVTLLNDQLSFRLVFKGEGYRFARLDLNRLTLGINQKTGRGAGLGDHHTLAGLQTLNADLSVFVCPVDAVAVTDEGPVGVHHLKLGVLKGDRGVDRADLTDEQDAVRGVVKGDGDHVLLTLIRDVDGLGGVDDGVAVRGADFLNNIGPLGQPGPDAGSVLPCGFLPDHGAASTGSAAQEAKLEGAAGKGLMGHAVVLFDHDGV